MGEPESPTYEATVRRPLAMRRSLAFLAVCGFAVPIIAYFWLIHRYALNIIRADQWSDIQIIADSYSGHLSFSALWAQHYENRIFFPNLIVLLLSRTTNFNVLVEEYLSAVLLVASTGLLIVAHRRRGGLPWVYYCPVAFLMLSFVQHQNTLWGFQLAWYVVLFAVAVTFTVLDRLILTWWWLAIALASAVVASYSSLQGLILWPTGLLLLYYRNRPKSFMMTWVSVALVTVVFYFVDYAAAPGTDASAIQHPIATIEFYLVALGDVVGVNVSDMNAIGIGVLLLGLVIFVASICVLVTSGRGRDETSGMPITVALITFGLVFAALFMVGRISEGVAGASQSRFRTFDLLTVVGLYLAVLDQFVIRRRATRSSQLPEGSPDGIPEGSERERTLRRRHPGRGFVILAVPVLAMVCLQVGVGAPEGLAGARNDHANQVLVARVDVNINRYPGTFVQSITGVFYQIGFIREMAEVAQVHHLSLFATGAVAEYRADGLIADTSRLSTSITIPTNGAKLKGSRYLSATAHDYFGVSRVEFEITGEEPRDTVVINAKPYPYGWLGTWKTTNVPNGPYILESIAYNAAGRVAHSRTVSVIVKNE